MKPMDWFWAVVEAALWYGIIWFTLYVIKNPFDLFLAAAILLVASYAAVIACPWVRNTHGWKRMWGKEE